RFDGHGGVPMVGCCNDDGVYVRPCQKLAVIEVACAIVGGGGSGFAFAIHVGDGDELAGSILFAQGFEIAKEIHSAATEADDAVVNAVVGWSGGLAEGRAREADCGC